ncbi:hypothetical protein BV898_03328 [Hypsibius exemplaris]|uniref:Uncharacterized protein n=1 Tax=Hypsibius exemplaris TaxID=2072580 RepID=A0A1W0X663_HYPEX|nr:hypothetical protein BV898_03328 [Hypsibius exemplaris]
MAAISSRIAFASKAKPLEIPQGSVGVPSDGSSSSDNSLSDGSSCDDNDKYMHVPPERYANELVRYCKFNTDERMAMILILLGPEYLQAIVGKFKEDPNPMPPVTEAQLVGIRSSASKVLDRHDKNWTSAMLMNGSEEEKLVAGQDVPPPAWKKGPSKRLKEFYALCSENSFERVALVFLVMGPGYLDEIYYEEIKVFGIPCADKVSEAAEKVLAIARNSILDDVKVLRAIDAPYAK